MSGKSRRGSALVEFTFAGIPILFTIISVIEISRCMWTLETLSYAVTEGSRMAVVHGADCALPPNSCSITVASIAQRIADSAQGLLVNQMSVTLASAGVTVTCTPLSSCLSNSTSWSVAGNTAGTSVVISAVYPFQSPMAIFFPGLTNPTSWVTANLPASSQEPVQF
jgi:Flp pilus assembly protein TadG